MGVTKITSAIVISSVEAHMAHSLNYKPIPVWKKNAYQTSNHMAF